MNIEEEVIEHLGNEIAKSIDAEVLMTVLVNCGWQMIKLDRFKDNRHAVDIGNWCVDNVKGKWQHSGSTFIFEQHKDATWFALTWL